MGGAGYCNRVRLVLFTGAIRGGLTGGIPAYWGVNPLLGIICGVYGWPGGYMGCGVLGYGGGNCELNGAAFTGKYWGAEGPQAGCCGQATYWDRDSKLSESSRRCLFAFLLPPFGLSLAETELARDTPLLSSPSGKPRNQYKITRGLASSLPCFEFSVFSTLPKIRCRALLYASSRSSLVSLEIWSIHKRPQPQPLSRDSLTSPWQGLLCPWSHCLLPRLVWKGLRLQGQILHPLRAA
jgi:hypothetical protein